MYISSSVSGLLRNPIGLYYTKKKGLKYYVLQLAEIGISKRNPVVYINIIYAYSDDRNI